MTVIFKLKSKEAYTFKILAELLANNIKTGCFEIDEEGVSLCMMDYHKKILINLKLNENSFPTYKFNSKTKMFLGINLNHFHKMLKSIKKKDSIELYIESDSPNILNIKVIPKENTRVTISSINIQTIQNIIIDIPEGYSKPIIVSSSEYQKMIKEINNIGTVTKVIFKKSYIDFSCNASDILKKTVRFGEDEDDEDDENVYEEFVQHYDTEQLCHINKLSGLSNNIKICKGQPIRFESNIGNIGKISVYIKSKEQIEESLKIDDSKSTSDSDSE